MWIKMDWKLFRVESMKSLFLFEKLLILTIVLLSISINAYSRDTTSYDYFTPISEEDYNAFGLNVVPYEIEEIPNPHKFIVLDNDVHFDLEKIYTNIDYPELTNESRLAGKVHIKVLIGKKGEILKCIPMNTRNPKNEVLEKMIIEAINKSEDSFSIGYQNDKPILYWITIPFYIHIK
ncbi:MAG: hypothetical protein Kapaf2KO_08220 [Candidatus Kapaibacteriales bacterium]